MNDAVAAFRAQYREQHIGRSYRGWLHFGFTVSMASTIIVLCALQVHDATPWEWLTLPLTFVYANFAEYFGHKGPMHHLRPGG